MPSEARQHARQQQRDRAVLREAELRDQAAARQRTPYRPQSIHVLTSEQEVQYPSLVAVRQQGREPRCDRGSSRGMLRRLQGLREQHGPLNLITLVLSGCTAQHLQEDAGRQLVVATAKQHVDAFLAVHGRRVTAYAAVIEHGLHRGLHAHLVVPHAQLSGPLQQATDAARPWTGKWDGCGHRLPQDGHAVRVGERPEDFTRVASYLTKHPDARARLKPGHPDHLALKDELAQLMLDGLVRPRVKLSWSTIRRTPTATRGATRRCTLLINTSS